MLTKAQALASCRHEVSVIQHLAGKIEEGSLEYRPTEGQRSTLELLQYLTVSGIITARYIGTQNWEHAAELGERSKGVTLATFAPAMDTQMAEIETSLADLDDAALATLETTMPWGSPCTGGEALVNMVLKTFVAYRMQLFLYMRSCGADVTTMNCWVGMDPQ